MSNRRRVEKKRYKEGIRNLRCIIDQLMRELEVAAEFETLSQQVYGGYIGVMLAKLGADEANPLVVLPDELKEAMSGEVKVAVTEDGGVKLWIG